MTEEKVESVETDGTASQLIALERFATDNPKLSQLETSLAEFDAFSFLGVSRYEETHSKLLAWLLDPGESHGMGDLFLTMLLSDTGAVTEKQLRTTDWSYSTVEREWYNVVDERAGFLDILVRNDRARFVCAIENKVFSSEHSNQLSRYSKAIESEFGRFDKSLLFLSRQASLPDQPSERDTWIPVGYETILRLVETLIGRGANCANEAVIPFLRQYATTLRRTIVPNDQVKRMVTRIYLEHRDAIDLIYRHREDYIGLLKESFVEAVNHQEGWEYIGEREGSRLLAFIPENWKKFSTFHTGTTLPNSDAVLWFDFDFRVIGQVTLILTMSAGDIDNRVRKQMFDDTRGRHPGIFDFRGSPKGEYSVHTVRLYASSPVVSERQIIDEESSVLRSQILEWVSNFAEGEFQQIYRVVVDIFQALETDPESMPRDSHSTNRT